MTGATAPPSSDLFLVNATAEQSEYRERLRIVAATRAAQRGIDASEGLIKDLLDGVVNAQDTVEMIDLNAYNGDFEMAALRLKMAGGLKCKVRCIMVEIPGKNGSQSKFAMKRHGWWQVGLNMVKVNSTWFLD